MKKIKHIIIYSVVIIIILLLYVFTVVFFENVADSIYNSIMNCLNTIIPSLFFYLSLSAFLIKSNLYVTLSKPFSLLSRYIFKMESKYFSIFLLSLFSGYPTGAKLICDLKSQDKISETDAESMLMFCYSPSPTFVITLVGIALFGNIGTGFIVYLSVITTNIILAISYGIIKSVPLKEKGKSKISLNISYLVESVESAGKTLFIICSMIIFFSVIVSILVSSGLLNSLSIIISEAINADNNSVLTVIKTLIEISNIKSLDNNAYKFIPLITSLFSFGGFCIIIQVISIIKGKLKLKKFYISRIISAVISYFISLLYIQIFEINLSVSNIVKHSYLSCKTSIIPSLLIVIMTLMLLCNQNNINLKRRNDYNG